MSLKNESLPVLAPACILFALFPFPFSFCQSDHESVDSVPMNSTQRNAADEEPLFIEKALLEKERELEYVTPYLLLAHENSTPV